MLRGLIVPGGVTRDIPVGVDVAGEVERLLADFEEVAAIPRRPRIAAPNEAVMNW